MLVIAVAHHRREVGHFQEAADTDGGLTSFDQELPDVEHRIDHGYAIADKSHQITDRDGASDRHHTANNQDRDQPELPDRHIELFNRAPGSHGSNFGHSPLTDGTGKLARPQRTAIVGLDHADSRKAGFHGGVQIGNLRLQTLKPFVQQGRGLHEDDIRSAADYR